jgi:hypothetical protein
VLKQTALYQVVGATVNDDGGATEGTKMGGGTGKKSLTKDILSGVSQSAPFAAGTPASNVKSLSITGLEGTFALTPAGKTNSSTMSAAATASQALSSLFGPSFMNAAGRKGWTNVQSGQACGFYADVPITSPTYGATLFDLTQNALFTGNLTGLTTLELGQLSAYFNSANGSAGAVVEKHGGFDYHGQTANTIGTQDVEVARSLVMFLAACDKAKSRGAWICTSNGSAQSGQGNTPGTTINIGGNSNGTTTITCSPHQASGDSGGAYSASHLVLCDFTATPALPPGLTAGTFANDGTTTAGTITTALDSLAALYLTAAAFLGQQTVDMNLLAAKVAAAGSSGKSFI